MRITVGAGYLHATHPMAGTQSKDPMGWRCRVSTMQKKKKKRGAHARVVVMKVNLTGLVEERRPTATTVELGFGSEAGEEEHSHSQHHLS